MDKVMIRMDIRPKHGEVRRAATELGVSTTAILRYLKGEKHVLGAAHRARISVRYPRFTKKG